MKLNRIAAKPDRHCHQSGQTLIGLLVVVVILIALSLMFLGPRRSGGGEGEEGEERPSIAKQSIDRGKDVELQNNLSQIRRSIDMYKMDNDGKPPASLQELKSFSKFPESMFVNPLDGRPLNYDSQSGAITAQPASGPGTGPSGAVPGAAAPGAPVPPVPGVAPKIPAPSPVDSLDSSDS